MEKQDDHHLEILFADYNLKMILLIDFKLGKVEGQNPDLFWYVQDKYHSYRTAYIWNTSIL